MPTVFLDRDGVLVRDRPGYIRTPEQLELLPGAATAVQRFRRAGWRVILITNQSLVGRGLIGHDTLDRIHARLNELVATDDGGIDAVFVCPHRPDDGCDCRKPKLGLFLRARDEAGVRLDEAVMIGDMPTDAEAAIAAGCRAVLVGSHSFPGVATVDSLSAAASLLLDSNG